VGREKDEGRRLKAILSPPLLPSTFNLLPYLKKGIKWILK